MISPKRESQHKSKISINFSVYAYMSKKLQMESTTFRARIMNYNPFAYKATMYFECQTDFGRWVKFSCITMSLFIVMYIHFSCNVNKLLSLNTISLNIFDRGQVSKLSPFREARDALILYIFDDETDLCMFLLI